MLPPATTLVPSPATPATSTTPTTPAASAASAPVPVLKTAPGMVVPAESVAS